MQITTNPDVEVSALRFLSDDFDPGNPRALRACFEALHDREVETPAALREWILDYSELFSYVDGEDGRRLPSGYRGAFLTRPPDANPSIARCP